VKHSTWRETAELVGIFAILASLIFVALQLRQEQVLTLSEMRASMVANSVAINNSIIENANIWVRGNEGQELSPVEQAAYDRLVLNVNDYYFQVRQTFLVIEPEWETHILTDFAGFLYDHPGAYQSWINREHKMNAHRHSVDPSEEVGTEWVEAIESKLAILKQNQP